MGLTLGVIDAKLFGATLFMACATTLIAPPLIQVLFRKQSPAIGAVAENRS